MTNEFDQALIDSKDDFLTTFGETVVYWPRTGGSREITAIVGRDRPDDLDGVPHGQAPRLTINVANDETDGISSSEVDKGGDKVELAVKIGETAQQRRITKILYQDAGMMKLELR